MWYAVHDAFGALVSLGTVLPTSLPTGLAAVALDVEPDLSAQQWDAQARALVPRAAAPTPLTRLQFLRRIPTAARIAIRAAAGSDPVLADALQLLDMAQDVSVTDPDTVRLIGYLQQQELLTAAEAAEVLA